jgi:hypothetical protein
MSTNSFTQMQNIQEAKKKCESSLSLKINDLHDAVLTNFDIFQHKKKTKILMAILKMTRCLTLKMVFTEMDS